MSQEFEELPPQEEDDNEPEDRNQLLEQLKLLASQGGPTAGLLLAGHKWLQGHGSSSELLARAAEFESELDDDLDPLVASQLDRLEEGLQDGEPDQVLYALLGLGSQAEST